MTTASVVFSTITGNTEAIADIIVDHLRNAKIVVKKTEISQTEVSDILASDIIVIAPYTYDLGGLPCSYTEIPDYFLSRAESEIISYRSFYEKIYPRI
ncbi:flavodoxin domain-containing protein [Leuconostoc rapi]|uniref:flavodoxin domain-containing protein n=1 Tax=Leuconostoc rapi TaxID=1406906 RepID=UPI00195A8A9D|nr:flavodoxin domain-containing protein [Leuconostoc rapi]MBM7436300.1 flavodoxin [Leuconostoc rapi]